MVRRSSSQESESKRDIRVPYKTIARTGAALSLLAALGLGAEQVNADSQKDLDVSPTAGQPVMVESAVNEETELEAAQYFAVDLSSDVGVNLRRGPGTDAAVAGTVPPGAHTLLASEQNGSWFKLVTDQEQIDLYEAANDGLDFSDEVVALQGDIWVGVGTSRSIAAPTAVPEAAATPGEDEEEINEVVTPEGNTSYISQNESWILSSMDLSNVPNPESNPEAYQQFVVDFMEEQLELRGYDTADLLTVPGYSGDENMYVLSGSNYSLWSFDPWNTRTEYCATYALGVQAVATESADPTQVSQAVFDTHRYTSSTAVWSAEASSPNGVITIDQVPGQFETHRVAMDAASVQEWLDSMEPGDTASVVMRSPDFNKVGHWVSVQMLANGRVVISQSAPWNAAIDGARGGEQARQVYPQYQGGVTVYEATNSVAAAKLVAEARIYEAPHLIVLTSLGSTTELVSNQ